MVTRFRSRRKLRKEKSVPPIQLLPLSSLGEIKEGHDLSGMLVAAARKSQLALKAGDILVIAQKVISKSEGRAVNLSSIEPSVPAATLAAKRNRDARLVEVVLRESRRIVRDDPVIITETHHGYVCANSGVDHSNVPGTEMVTLLPVDPDQSAARLAQGLPKRTGAPTPGVTH